MPLARHACATSPGSMATGSGRLALSVGRPSSSTIWSNRGPAVELAVMVDTFRPLKMTKQALAIEDESYWKSWQK